jgi:hypothetical protein
VTIRWVPSLARELEEIEVEFGQRITAQRTAVFVVGQCQAWVAAGQHRLPARLWDRMSQQIVGEPADSDAMTKPLRCSGSWADKLTAQAREAARRARDAEIIRLKDAGRTHREVADAVGLKSP